MAAPVEAPAPVQVLGEDIQELPRRSARPRFGPDRLVVTGNGKSYVDVVKENLGKPRGRRMCLYNVPVGPPAKPLYLPPGGVILNYKIWCPSCSGACPYKHSKL